VHIELLAMEFWTGSFRWDTALSIAGGTGPAEGRIVEAAILPLPRMQQDGG
jgi:hypothetical protein